MKTYYEKMSISMKGEDRQFIKETAEKKGRTVSGLIQDVISEYRKFDAYCNRIESEALLLSDKGSSNEGAGKLV